MIASGSEDENATITRAMLGEEADFARLVTAHYDRIYQLAWRFAGRREDAEDIAQEVCIKLAHHLQTYHFDAPFHIWVGRITMNAARDFLRSRTRRQNREAPLFEDMQLEAPGENPERLAMVRELLRRVDALPDALREAVILVYGEGMSHREAGLALGCAESTVSWRIHEARKQLKPAPGKEDGHAKG